MANPERPAGPSGGSEEIAPVTAPSIPGRTVLGGCLAVFGLAIVGAAVGIFLAQGLWRGAGGERVEPVGLWLAAAAGLIWAGTGAAVWQRRWLLGGIGIALGLISGAVATWLIRG